VAEEELFRGYPKLQIMKLLYDANWLTVNDLKNATQLDRKHLYTFCEELQNAGYIEKSKRLVDSYLVSCFAISHKGRKQLQDYSNELREYQRHINDEEQAVIPNHELFESFNNDTEIHEILTYIVE